MKKLYTILLSAAVALGASAATETVSLQLSKNRRIEDRIRNRNLHQQPYAP